MPVKFTLKKQLVESKGQVEAEVKKGPKKQKEEVVQVAAMDVPFANVGMSLSHTINLGNYESAKITISLFLPSQPNEKDINNAFTNVKDWVDGKMSEMVDEIDLIKGAK